MTVEERIAEHGAWARGIARSMMRKLPPSIDVEDMMQCALIGLWKAAERFDEEQGVPFQAWAHVFVQGECWMAVRRRSYTEATHAELHDVHAGQTASLDEVIQQETLTRALGVAVTFLPAGSREKRLVEAYCLCGMPMRDVAVAMGLSERTCVDIRLSALKMLREELRRLGITARDIAA